MRVFGVKVDADDADVDSAVHAHPSAPIPVTGPGLGEQLRVPIGDSGQDTFPLMLGGAEFGWNIDVGSSQSILDRFVEFGGNAVHTADGYSGGRSEHIIGQWLRSRGLRDRVIVGVRIGSHADNPGLGAVNLVRAVEASLTRLGVDRIDVMYLDASADESTNLEDTLATADWLRESGKIATVGAFGLTPEQLVEARILAAAGYPRIEVIDEPYNLVRRQPYEGDLRLVAAAQGVALTPSHALEHGFLSGQHRNKRTPSGVRGEQLRALVNRRGIKILRALDAVASDLHAPIAAISVAWLLAQRTVVAPIVNAFALSHVDELVQGAGISLTRTQVADLTRASD